MNGFDNFDKRTLKVKHYIRYVDDFVLFDTSRQRFEEQKKAIRAYLLEELELRSDSRLRRHDAGLDFLGCIIREHYTLVRQRVVNNYERNKARYLDRYEALRGTMHRAEIKKFLSPQASFAAHCKHANSYKLYQTTGVIDEKNPFDYDRP